MILTKNIEITINSANIKHFKSLGYENLIPRNKLIVPIEHLSLGSTFKVDTECDICGKQKNITYSKYLKNINNCGFFACSEKCGNEKTKIHNLKNFGVEYYCQTEEAKKRNKQTLFEKYGDENYNNREKTINTLIEKHGTYKYSNREKCEKTCMEKYGVKNVFQSEEIKDKNKKIFFEKYGVEHQSQNEEVHNKQKESAFHRIIHESTNLSYQGTYEKDFLDFCFENNIPIQKGKRIKYSHNEKDHYYFSDFYYEPLNLIIEIKSSYTYEKNLEVNLAKKEASISEGFQFLFIIDKDYSEFKRLYN